MLRSLLEKWSRNRSIKRKLPREFGSTPLFVSPDAQLKYLKLGRNAFDPMLLKLVEEEIGDGMNVWDIGANVGVFTLASASYAKDVKVLAVEADIWLAHLINSSKQLSENRHLDISVLPAAVSDVTGISCFKIASRGRASNALAEVGGRSQMGGVRDEVQVPTVTLDGLLDYFPSPNIVKIDVEGAEGMVLKGGHRLLKDVRPVIIIEVGQKITHEVSEILHSNNYKIYDATVTKDMRSELPVCPFNAIAVPIEFTVTDN